MIKVVDVNTMRISDKEKIKEVGSTNLMYEAGKSIYNSFDFSNKK